MRQLVHPARVRLAEAGERGCGEQGMNGRHLELVADGATGSARQKLIGVDRCGAPAKPSTRSGINAADTTVGCRKVRLPTTPCGSGTSLRNSNAGVPIAPAAAMKIFARTTIRRGVGSVPRASRPMHSSAPIRPPGPFAGSSLQARVRVSRVAPRASAAGNRGDQHRLLGVGRTAHAAVADIPATHDIAPDGGRLHAKRLGAASQRLVVLVRQRRSTARCQAGVPCARTRARARRLRIHRAQMSHANSAASPSGVRKLDCPVDRRAAADAATLQDVDRLVAGLAAADSW